MFKKFIISFLVCFLALFSVLAAAFFIFLKFSPSVSSMPSNVLVVDSTPKNESSFISTFMSVPKKTNFLVTGLDKSEARTDVILVGSFDSQVGSINIISIPRDSKVTLSDSLYNEMREKGYRPPKSLNINEIHSYAKDDGAYFTEKFLEEFLGINIDYKAEINFEAFRYIVDAVGGIEFDVRPQGYYYSDPYQNLTISISGGHQVLNGEQAEGLVRFRKYRMGDLDRINIQQDFMKEFFRQVLNKETIMNNSLDIITAAYNYVDTDFPLKDVPKYLKYIEILDPNNFNMTTLPGNTADGVSYFIPNTIETQELVNEVFYKTNIDFENAPLTSAKIQVLNGAKISGLAGKTRDMLINNGYDVSNIGNYTNGTVNQTKIITSSDIDTSELDKYFNNPVHEISDEFSSFYDVTIVLGTNESQKLASIN